MPKDNTGHGSRRDHYEGMTQPELVDLLVRRDGDRQLGLVWERERLEADEGGAAGFVALQPEADLSLGPAPWRNLVIEGDNLPALRHLLMSHRGQVKCIYIDPPYNTGNKDWVYNDRFVEKTDRFRHSQWLEWMYRRLYLARDLLRDDGVILVSISDENRAVLELMMDRVFPGKRVGSLVWRSRIGGNDDADYFLSVNHEHVLVYANPGFRFGGHEKTFDKYIYDDGDGRGLYRISDLTQSKTMAERKNGYYPLQDPATGFWYPAHPNAVWRFVHKKHLTKKQRKNTRSIEEMLEDDRVIFPQGDRVETWDTMDDLLAAIDAQDVPWRGNAPILRRDLPDLEFWVGKPVGWGSPQMKRYKSELRNQTQPLSSWVRYSKDDHETDDDQVEIAGAMTEEGTKLLNTLFGEKVFNYPKPPSLIRELLRQVTDDESLVVDFFAGSGVTGQAVLELNAEDDGNRRFILVSNTEATEKAPDRNICRDVLMPRLRAIIDGYEKRTAKKRTRVPGVGGDAAYLRIVPMAYSDLPYDLTDEQVWAAVQVLHDLPLRPFDPDTPFQRGGDERGTLVYARTIPPAVLETLQGLEAQGPLTVWTWTPTPAREGLDTAHTTVHALPKALKDAMPR